MHADAADLSRQGRHRITTAAPAAPATQIRRRRTKRSRRFVVGRAGRYLLLVIMAVIVGFPIYITVVNALLTPAQIAHRPPVLFPTHPLWSAFSEAWSTADLDVYLRNSVIVSVAISVFEVVTSVLAAYAFAFVRFPFRRVIFILCLATLMVPMEAIIVPNRQTIVSLGWFNSFPALIVPFIASGLGVFLFRQAFMQLPRDLKDAATLDGYGHLRFLSKVVVPINRPMIGAFALYAFLGSWNQYLWPLIVTDTNSVRTVQIGLRQLNALSVDQINVIFAGTLLASLPIFFLLLVFQRQLVRGLPAGALKG
jgi:sn-glycerol 3-phosphate transport system permease protein